MIHFSVTPPSSSFDADAYEKDRLAKDAAAMQQMKEIADIVERTIPLQIAGVRAAIETNNQDHLALSLHRLKGVSLPYLLWGCSGQDAHAGGTRSASAWCRSYPFPTGRD